MTSDGRIRRDGRNGRDGKSGKRGTGAARLYRGRAFAHTRHIDRVALALALVPALGGCTQFENAMASIPVFSFLRNSPALDPYEAPRPAPPNSVPFASPAGDVPLPIPATEAGLTAFGATATNPLQAGDTLALRAGQVMYERHCAVCHGDQGLGNGPIVNKQGEVGKFPPIVPNLTLPGTVARTDGYLYGIIAVGRGGLMPAYGPRMTHIERWATVLYLRQLQRQSGAASPARTAPPAAAAPREPVPESPDTSIAPEAPDANAAEVM